MLISGAVMSHPSRPSFAGGAVTGLTISLLVSPPDTTKEFFLDPPLDLDSEAANKTLKSQSSPRLNICCLVTSVQWWVSYVDLGQGTEYSMKDYATQPVYNVTWKHFNSNIDSEYQFKLDFASIVGVYRNICGVSVKLSRGFLCLTNNSIRVKHWCKALFDFFMKACSSSNLLMTTSKGCSPSLSTSQQLNFN